MEELSKELLELIQNESGLKINDAHLEFMRHYVESRLKELNITEKDYNALILSDTNEKKSLINEAAINETYFFREEQQFDFIKQNYIEKKDKNSIITLWSAACSTGEEALSLYTLASSCGIKPIVYATDIDTKALEVFKKGYYSLHSFRSDGKKYIPLLESIGDYYNNTLKLRQPIENLHIQEFNLVSNVQLPMQEGTVDIIFLRNVFIYFDAETRHKIILKLSSALKKNGLLFLSINEVAGVECADDIPLIKEHSGTIYYFRKVSLKEKKEKKKPKVNIPPIQFEDKDRTENKTDKKIVRESFKTIKPVKKTYQKEQIILSKQSSPDLKKLVKDVNVYIDNNNTSKALELVENYHFRPENLEYRFYLEGLIALEDEKENIAEDFFQRASFVNPKFWPALFQLALAQHRSNNIKSSVASFKSCAMVLKEYIKGHKDDYNFLMESFSSTYFLQLCERYINIGQDS